MPTTAARPLACAAATLTTAFMLAAPAHAAGCDGATTVPQTAEEVEQATRATVCLVNAERTARGLRAYRRDRDLARAARDHSADMVRRDYFAHTAPDGTTLKDRILDAGYGDPGDGWRAGEALGWGTGERATPRALVDAWLDSAKHRGIVLAKRYRELGVGVAGGAPKRRESPLPGATYTLNTGRIR